MSNGQDPNESPIERWYYDACTLVDQGKSAYAEMFSRHHPIKVVVSHLAFGEAYANSHLKGVEAISAFIQLMHALRSYIQVVTNDNCDHVLKKVQEKFPRLSITDALHVATAIQNRCVVMKTSDRDLYGLSPTDLNQLGAEFDLQHFSINKMVFRS